MCCQTLPIGRRAQTCDGTCDSTHLQMAVRVLVQIYKYLVDSYLSWKIEELEISNISH
jgi:hypothetical protein